MICEISLYRKLAILIFEQVMTKYLSPMPKTIKSFLFTKTIVLMILLLGCVSIYANTTQAALELKIQNTQGTEQVQLIKTFIKKYSRISPEKSLDYANIALKTLKQTSLINNQAWLYAYMARANIYLKQHHEATNLINNSFNIANDSNDHAGKILAYKVMSEIQLDKNSPQEAIKHLNSAMDIAEQQNDTQQLASLINKRGRTYSQIAKFDLALADHLTAHQLYKYKENQTGLAQTLGYIGTVYRASGDFEAALKHQLQATMLKQDLGDKRALAVQYNNTAIVYKDIGEYDNAIKMHKKSLALKTELNYQKGMIFSYNNLGETSRLAGNIPDALTYLHQARELAISLRINVLKGASDLYLGRLHRDQKEFTLAFQYLEQALIIFTEDNNGTRLAETYLALGKLHFLQGNMPKAIIHTKKSIQYAEKTAKNTVLLGAYLALSEFNESVKNYQESLAYFKSYTLKQQQIFSQEAQLRAETLKVKFAIDQKQREIKALTQKNQITSLELSKQAAEKNTMIVTMLLILLFSFSTFIWLIKSKQQQTQLKIMTAIKNGKERLKLALWGSGDSLWDWNLATGNMSRENIFTDIKLPQRKIGYTITAMQAYIHPDDFDKVSTEINRYIHEQHKDFFEASYRIKDNNNNWIWILDRGKVVERDHSGMPKRMSGTLKDISQLKQHELALQELNNQLELRVKQRTEALTLANTELSTTLSALTETQSKLVEVEKMAALGSLITGIAHEMNTPLGTCVTASSVLHGSLIKLDTLFKDKTLSQRELKKIIEQLKSSESLISNNTKKCADLIMQFKQIANTSHQAHLLNLSELISTKLSIFQNQHNDVISTSYSESETVTLMSFANSFDIIMETLLFNSLQHAINEQTLLNISVHLDTNDHFISLTYQDDGVGIQDEIAKNIFDPFFTTKRNQGNIGLGLHIVYNQVTQQLKGNISYQKNSPQGVRFTITLPRKI